MRISALFLGAALTAVPAAAQGPAPLGPKTLVPENVACTNRPTTDVPVVGLHIAAPHTDDDRELAYQNGVVVLSAGTPAGIAPGQRFYTRRYYPPASREPISPAVRGSIKTTGWLTVIAADEHSALARIDYACTGVASGDFLEPYADTTLPSSVAPEAPTDFGTLGKVLFGVDRRESFGAGDILSIDRGATQGMAAGTRIGFFRDRRNGTPLVELGSGIVIEVDAASAKVVVDRARYPVFAGDYYGVKH